MAEAIPLLVEFVSSLEVILHAHLDDAIPLFDGGVAKVRITLSHV